MALQKFLANFATKLQKCAFAVSRQIEGAKNDNTLLVYEIKRGELSFFLQPQLTYIWNYAVQLFCILNIFENDINILNTHAIILENHY